MSDEIKDITLIEAYLNDELGAKQRLVVEARRDNDPAFAQLMQDLEVMFAGTESAFREEVLSQFQGIEQNLPPVEIDEASLLMDDVPPSTDKSEEGPPAKVRSMRRWWLIAATLIPLLAVGTWLFWPKPSVGEQLFASHFAPASQQLIPVTRNGNQDAVLQKAKTAFEQENYIDAATIYEEDYKASQDLSSTFYQGVAYLGAGQGEEAISLFDLYKSKGKNLRLLEELDYWKALAFVQTEQWQSALGLLEGRKDRKSVRLLNDIQKYSVSQ